MKVAALDLGTNSFLCLIAEINQGRLRILDDRCEIVRLGEDIQKTGRFSEQALMRAKACLEKFKKQIDYLKVENVAAVATSAARDVSNGQKLLDLGHNLSIPIQIIEGEKEAEYTFKGVLSGDNENTNFAVVDIGGGSTEFAYSEKGEIKLTSLDLGCVRHTEKYLSFDVSTEIQIQNFISAVAKELEEITVPNVKEIVAVAGTPTTLVCVKEKKAFDPSWVENSVLTLTELKELEKQFASLTLEQRKSLPGMEPKRADVILAGTIILRMITEKFKFKSVRVSTRGVRYGLALDLGSI